MQKLENRQISPHCILACLYFLLLPTTIAVNSAGNSILKLATVPIGLFFLITLILSNRKLQINGVHLALLLYTLSVVASLFCDTTNPTFLSLQLSAQPVKRWMRNWMGSLRNISSSTI